jgi:hypothetical protein
MKKESEELNCKLGPSGSEVHNIRTYWFTDYRRWSRRTCVILVQIPVDKVR